MNTTTHELIYLKLLENLKSLPTLCTEYNVNLRTMYSYIRKKHPEHKYVKLPTNDVNHNYLDNPYYPDKMYFLGMMLAGGYVSTSVPFIGLKLKQSDQYLVEKLLKLIAPTRTLNKTGLGIRSTKLYEKLINLGCVPQKTQNKFKLPELNQELFFHFLRGYFDGDGSISLRKHRRHQVQVYICSIDFDFLNQLKLELIKYNIVSTIYMEKRNGKPLKLPRGGFKSDCLDMYTLRVSGFKNLLKLYENLYKNSELKLERKYKIFSAYYVNTVLTLATKYPKAVQRIDIETFKIDYEYPMNLAACYGKEIKAPLNKEILEKLYIKDKIPAIKIAKLLKCSRTFVTRWLKEYNISKSAR